MLQKAFLRPALYLFLVLMLPVWGCNNSGDEMQETTVGKVKIPALLKRNADIKSSSDDAMIADTYHKAIDGLKANPDDLKPYLQLASVYITEGRITGNGGYYSLATVNVLDRVLNSENANQDQRFQAYSLKSTVLLNMHQFKQALDVAGEGLKISAYNSGLWGCIVDAQLELGHYKEAVDACDKMLSLRPDLRSYSRASYLRQIYGDNRGAIEAMKMAVQSGVPGLEQTEWARVQLGDLYYNTGNLDSASFLYRSSLVYRPDYPFAKMAMARVWRANKSYDTGIADTRTAIKSMSESSFVAYLADMYELKGDIVKAAEIRKDVLRLIKEGEEKAPKNAPIQHNVSREMAMAYMNTGDYTNAQIWAKKDYDMRPDNIDANDLMGWIAYLKKDYPTAKAYAEKTLITNIKNALLLYKDGIIFSAAGDKARGDAMKAEALKISPYIDPRIIKAGNA